MPLPNLDVPPFADVPPLPGVPPLIRNALQAFAPVALQTADALGLGNLLGTQWGVFDQNGVPALLADSVIGVEVQRDFRISDYPTEEGGFQSYNKVAVPIVVRITFAISGQLSLPGELGVVTGALATALQSGGLGSLLGIPGSKRAAFLAGLDDAIESLDPYVVVTPDAIYPSVNIVHYDYRRFADAGASLLLVNVWVEEVRVTTPAQLSNTQSASGAPQQEGGSVQGVPGSATVAPTDAGPSANISNQLQNVTLSEMPV